MGAPAVMLCYFELWAVENVLETGAVARVTFGVTAGTGQSVERLSGFDRQHAEEMLGVLSNLLTSKGARRIADGHQWYSHRFAIDDADADRIFESLPPEVLLYD